MKLVKEIVRYADDLTAIRRDFHANPEIGFEEERTAAIVADKLTKWGVEVHTGIGGTGVIGVIRGHKPGGTIGLRADMDALPMQELADVPYRSTQAGVFHGCGHDGHTTMLLGAARYMAATRKFPGEIRLIFQPAEEGLGGARAMIADGLFQRFPCDEVYGLHNWPEEPVGRITIKPGIAMAASDQFDISIGGQGAHGAQPQLARDPTIVAVTLAQALQSIISRNVSPLDAAVLSITKLHAG
jgi:amidohydrolase